MHEVRGSAELRGPDAGRRLALSFCMTTKSAILDAIAATRLDIIQQAREWVTDDTYGDQSDDVMRISEGQFGTSFLDIARAAMTMAWDSPSFLSSCGIDNTDSDHAVPTTLGWKQLASIGVTPEAVHLANVDFEGWDS